MPHKADHPSPTRMADVARHSRVSLTTGSTTLCGPEKVSPLMRRQVLRGIKAMGHMHYQYGLAVLV
ncbi:MAG TPA: LacI family DNA-binding transcriptional regulator [Candidatus Methylomirabilis sp.]|nr:LacI family DNA-binding transcriptional regulator [Candidatus Methylomirabilis sp.]